MLAILTFVGYISLLGVVVQSKPIKKLKQWPQAFALYVIAAAIAILISWAGYAAKEAFRTSSVLTFGYIFEGAFYIVTAVFIIYSIVLVCNSRRK